MQLILGSQSSGRKIVLERAGYEFITMAADIDEKAIRSDDYETLPLLIARAKTEALLPRIEQPSLLITSDQVAVWQNELREKPESPEEARRFLKSYGSAPVQTNTAVVVTNTITGKRYEAVDIARVYFAEIPDDVISQLIKAGDVYNCAGGYRIEDPLIAPYLIKIDGDPDSVSGLPLAATESLLKQATESL